MSNSDDDTPPPLSSLSSQVAALSQSGNNGISIAAVTSSTPGDKTKAAPGVKRGFFDSRPVAKTRSSKGHGMQQREADKIIHIKANGSKGASIPSEFILDQDSPSRQLQEVKQQLANALKPTPELMKTVTKNPQLLQGFDDPEVMAAVSEVASDPAAFKKYANNPKVVAFYRQMANFAATQLDSKAA